MKKTTITLLFLMIAMLSFGQVLLDKTYSYGEYRKNWALVEKDELYGFIDITGKPIVKPQYNSINKFGEYQKNWAMVQQNELYGFIDNDGKEIVKPIYESISKGNKIEGIINGKKTEITQ